MSRKVIVVFTLLLISISIKAQLSSFGYPNTSLFPYAGSNAVEIYKDVSSSYLFYNEGSVLYVADISTQGQIQILNSFRANFPIKYIAISPDGSRVAVSGDEKILVLDTSLPASPLLDGEFDFTDPDLEPQQQGGIPRGMAFHSNNTLITTVSPKGVWALDLSNVSDINISGEYFEPGTNFVWDVEIIDDFAFVADDAEGLSVIDISNPANLTLAQRNSSLSQARDIQIINNRAYITRGSNGVTLVDITTNPTLNLTTLGTITGNEIGAEWSGYANRANPLPQNHLAIATDFTHNGLVILDINNISQPVLVDKTSTSTNQFVTDDYIIYAAVGNPEIGYTRGIATYDCKDSQSSSVVPAVELDFMQNIGHNNKVSVSGATTLLNTDNGGTVVIDNSNLVRPEVGAWLIPDIEVNASVKINQFVLSASSNDKKLYVHDISDLKNPVSLPFYDFGLYRPQDIIVADTNAVLVITTRNYSEYFYNWMEIDNSGGLTLISQLSVIGNIFYSAKSGDMVLGGGANNFFILDYSIISTPVLVNSYSTTDVISNLEIEGNYAYIGSTGNVSFNYGVHVYDISNPAMATEVTFIDTTPVPVNSFDVDNNVMYVAADQLLGLVIFDVTTPASPVHQATYDTPGKALSIAVSDNVIALADENTGTFMFSNTDVIFANGFE
ncbi:MAG TPA: hypothetical protein PK055_10670 [Gammaproteobacteria bacterium]|mgnify:CR=1 FL=1|nr:hypothetical protein [Xanthomonadales bacterium]HOP23230.1 hypothetical protein [Gammaproteobacteria bacterium]HPI96612.1 hypothetical protein [Gammaproteobacteria bacterium]HPQ88111.1 hypothetical protein [Gammaproteobacteria bacterium]